MRNALEFLGFTGVIEIDSITNSVRIETPNVEIGIEDNILEMDEIGTVINDFKGSINGYVGDIIDNSLVTHNSDAQITSVHMSDELFAEIRQAVLNANSDDVFRLINDIMDRNEKFIKL